MAIILWRGVIRLDGQQDVPQQTTIICNNDE